MDEQNSGAIKPDNSNTDEPKDTPIAQPGESTAPQTVEPTTATPDSAQPSAPEQPTATPVTEPAADTQQPPQTEPTPTPPQDSGTVDPAAAATPPQQPVSEQAQPVQAAPAAAPPKANKKGGPMKMILMIFFALAVMAAGGYAVYALLIGGGGGIATSDLVDESISGVTFKRPSQWLKVEDDSADAAFTENGIKVDEADEGELVSTESLGVDYTTLNDEQKKILSDGFAQQFANPESLQDGNCKKVENVNTAEVARENYDTSFTIEATCTELEGSEVNAKIEMIVAIKGDQMHLMALVALQSTWDSSGDALNEILASMNPSIQVVD